MSHHFIDYESIGPRPPIPGEETKKYKMTDNSQCELHLLMTSSSQSSSSSPSCLKWARTLSSLLEDLEGVELFKKYVESEGDIHNDRLNFYFACEGLKQQSDPEKIKQFIGAIYKFLKKSKLEIPEDIKRTVKAGIKDEIILTPDVYDQLQQDVERIINETSYPNFLQSEVYLQHVQQATQSAIERNPISYTTTTTATSSTVSETSSKFLSRSSTLPTLMEEAVEGSTGDAEGGGAVGGFSEAFNRVPNSNNKVPMSLTKEALMATQRRRLDMRSPGAHGYSVYNNYAPYNPVSRRDSELASLSSGRTDSDTMSISSMSTTDGRPQRRHHHSRHQQNSIERMKIRENIAINSCTESLTIIPRTQRVDLKSHNLSSEEFLNILIPKLEAVKKEQDRSELLNKKLLEVEQSKSNKLFADAISAKLMLDDDNDDQDILDQHVSRVWSDRTPHRSPGNLSPCNALNQFPRRAAFAAGGSIQTSIRASKSMPASNISKFTKWGSINTDSGISLFSSDTITMKNRDAMSISSSSSSSTTKPPRQLLPPETFATSEIHSKLSQQQQQFEDVRRSKRYQQQPPLPQKNVNPPPIPAKNLPQQSQVQPAIPEFSTTVVCSFCDEELPYRIKIPGKSPPTLKQFKDFLPKKGNYRFFFKTRCDDEDNPIIQEEINNDAEVLPLFEGKVMATVKSAS